MEGKVKAHTRERPCIGVLIPPPPPNGMLVHRRVTSEQNVAGTELSMELSMFKLPQSPSKIDNRQLKCTL